MPDPEKKRADATNAGPQDFPTTEADCPAPNAAAQADEKAFRTVQALAALEGFGLYRDGSELILHRWNLTRVFRSADDVLAFLARLGRRP